MGNFPFDRCVVNTRERPLSSDIDRGFSLVAQALSEIMDRLTQVRASFGDDTAAQITGAGFNGDGFKVRAIATPAMQVRASQGLGWFFDSTPDVSIGSQPGLDDRARLRPLVLPSDEVINVPAAPAGGSERYDIVEVALGRLLTDQVSRNVLTATPPFAFNPTLVYKTLTFDLNGQSAVVAAPSASTAPLSLKTGVVAPTGTAVVPPTTAGYAKISEIYVGGAVTAIQPNVIKDLRTMLYPGGVIPVGIEAGVLNNVAPGTPSIGGLTAPPGIGVSLYAVPGTPGLANLFILSGALPAGVDVVASLVQATATPSLANSSQCGIAVSTVTVDSTLQANLVGANANPTLPVAIGQQLTKVALTARTFDSTVSTFFFNVAVMLKPF